MLHIKNITHCSSLICKFINNTYTFNIQLLRNSTLVLVTFKLKALLFYYKTNQTYISVSFFFSSHFNIKICFLIHFSYVFCLLSIFIMKVIDLYVPLK